MLAESPPDPTFVLSHAVAAAIVRDADEDDFAKTPGYVSLCDGRRRSKRALPA